MPGEFASPEALSELVGRTVPHGPVSYRVDSILGSGGTAVAFAAMRQTPQGETPVVLKILRPWLVKRAASTAMLAVRKEAVALGRLNERTPPSPFVVRLLDTGTVALSGGGQELPWLAIEFVHGGSEGTTLAERVERSVATTGSAFDPGRAALLVECIAHGLAAVHEVGVIHRDIKPMNILACGFGDQEVFKVSDFGIARPQGMETTFGGLLVGTPGYAAPEQASYNEELIGPWTDVFGFAAVIYFALTGEDYFQFAHADDALRLVRSRTRRKLTDGARLCAELRDNRVACETLDRALAAATSPKREERPANAEVLAAMVLPVLKADSERSRVAVARARAPVWNIAEEETTLDGWSFSMRQQPNVIGAIRSAAWDGDGRCLTLGRSGLALWTGTSWSAIGADGLPPVEELQFVHRVAPGKWLLGGDRATLATLSWEGGVSVVRGPDPGLSMRLASGELNEVAVMAASHAEGEPLLYAMAAKRWMRPLVLPDTASISHLARIADATWLVACRVKPNKGRLFLFSPLELRVHDVPGVEQPHAEIVACVGQPELGMWVALTHDGHVIWSSGAAVAGERAPSGSHPSACALDPSGAAWLADQRGLWFRRLARSADDWTLVSALPIADPIVAMAADVGVVRALTRTGGLVEGQQIIAGKA